MILDRLVELQRLRHWQGQTLRSRDLNDQLYYDAQLRAWHNRALHEAYGVHTGLEVTLEPQQQAVEVTPGLAYDAYGRELILGQPRQIPLPEAEIPEHGLRLVMSYAPDRRVGRSEGLSQACWPGDAPGTEPVSFDWQLDKWFDPRVGVPLARLLPGAQGPQRDPKFHPPCSKPLARPRLAHGATLPGNTPWRLWVEDIGGQETQKYPLGIQVEVDTSAVGFTDTPCYFAWLQGDLWAGSPVGFLDSIAADLDANPSLQRISDSFVPPRLLPMRFGHIHSPTESGFVYRLRLTETQLAYLIFLPNLLFLPGEGGLSVCWLGIQMNAQHVDTTQSNAGGTMALPKDDVREDYGIT